MSKTSLVWYSTITNNFNGQNMARAEAGAGAGAGVGAGAGAEAKIRDKGGARTENTRK